MAKWEPRNITIATRSKKEIVRAGFALGVYHVGRDEYSRFWAVTHIPTGLAFGISFRSIERAKEFAERAHRKTGEWMPRAKTIKDTSEITRVTAGMRRAKAKDGRSVLEVLGAMRKRLKSKDV